MIGIFGGTFDPIHYGHINLALEMMEAHHLDEVWFCPANLNPLKLTAHPISVQHRLKMLQLALEDIPGCRINDIELKRPGPSYTIDTLRTLVAQEKSKFCLIIGDDAASHFPQWRDPAEIVKLVPVFIGRRSLESLPQMDPAIYETLAKGATETRLMEISGTEIRQRLAQGLYCGHLLPAKVLDYIYANKLYF